MEESNQIGGGYEGVAVVEEPLNATGEQTPVGIVKVDRCNHARTERNRLRSPDFARRQYAKSETLAEYISNERQVVIPLPNFTRFYKKYKAQCADWSCGNERIKAVPLLNSCVNRGKL
jgi:hypothetical protein